MGSNNLCFLGFACFICRGEAIELIPYLGDASHDLDVCGRRFAAGETDSASLMFFLSRVWAFSLWHKSWKIVLP